MGAEIHRDENGLWVLRIWGALRKDELDAAQAAAVAAAGLQSDANVLIKVAGDFVGWVGGEVWGDMTFFVEHGDRIARIAIVGDPRWETEMLMFTGQGLRRAPVKYFANDEPAAYEWLTAGGAEP